jgi:hypothetical protein
MQATLAKQTTNAVVSFLELVCNVCKIKLKRQTTPSVAALSTCIDIASGLLPQLYACLSDVILDVWDFKASSFVLAYCLRDIATAP